MRSSDRFYFVQFVLYDLRRYNALVPVPGRTDPSMAEWWFEYEDGAPTSIMILSTTSTGKDGFIAVKYTRKIADHTWTEAFDIPWCYVREQLGRDRVGAPLYREGFGEIWQHACYRRTSNVHVGQAFGFGRTAEEILAPIPIGPYLDEFDVLFNESYLHHYRNPNPRRHMWKALDKLSTEIRRPKNWPFVDWGPLVPGATE